MHDDDPEDANVDARLMEALDGDPGDVADVGSTGLARLAGVLGVRDARDLGDFARHVIDIGRGSHSPFGDLIAAYGLRLQRLGHEAVRRLLADRLPDDAGTPSQSERLQAARREAAGDATDGEPAGGVDTHVS